MEEESVKTSRHSNGHSNHLKDKGGLEDGSKLKRSPRGTRSEKRQVKKRSASPVQQPRSSKRQRLQYQPFQSPTLEHLTVSKCPKSEEKVTVFFKGEFLALRNENGSFFVCQAAQNVYKSSRRFKIRWLSRLENKEDQYTPDFYDFTDFECVLTNLRMEKVDKNVFRLPRSETNRTENILRRALNLENGIHEPDLDQLEQDGVDVSQLKENQQKKTRAENSPSLNSNRKLSSPDNPRSSEGRQSNQGDQKVLRSSRVANMHMKQKATTSDGKLKSRSLKIRYKLPKGEEELDQSPRKDRKLSRNMKSSGREKLKPNSRITVYNKDPTFESNTHIPIVSVSVYSKLPIRAVLTKDTRLLQSLINDVNNVCGLNIVRSIDQDMDALAYALLQENHKAIQLILKELLNPTENRVRPPDSLLSFHSTGSYTMQFLGHAVKEVSLGRGNREGYNALIKETGRLLNDYDYIRLCIEHGVSKATLDAICNFPSQDKLRGRSLKEVAISRLYLAVRYGHRRLAGQLIEDALKMDGFGFNTLHKEVLLFDKQELGPYRAASVKKRAFSNYGITPIHCAAINPNPKYLSTLLAIESEFNIQDKMMRRPIHYAAACEGTGPLDFLFSKGIRADETDNDGNTVLHIASETGRPQNVELILKKARAERKSSENNLSKDFGVGGINRPNRHTYTSLHLACMAGRLEVVKVLLKFNTDVEKFTSAGKGKLTALMLACQKGHLEVIKLLIQHGAKIEARDKFKRTALTHAVINGHAHVTSHLLRLGADADTADNSGNTLIHYAAAYGWWFCLKLLLEAGADANRANDWMLTPLGVAFLKGHMGLVDLLLEQPGVDINVRDEKGISLLMLAVSSPLVPALIEQIRFLLEDQKAECCAVDPQGNTPFHWLARNSIRHHDKEEPQISPDAVATSLEIAKLLLEHGCDPSVRNEKGLTALTLAIEQGNNELVKMLLSDGCQVTAEVDDTGENLLHNLVEHAWETDLASLIHIIKESEPGKRKLAQEESSTINISKPNLPFLHPFEGGLKVGEIITLKGTNKPSSEEFSVDFLKSDDSEKDDIIFHLGVTCDVNDKKFKIVKNSRSGDTWAKEEEESISYNPEDADNLEITFTIQKEQIQITFAGNNKFSFTPSLPMDQALYLHIQGNVDLDQVQIQKATSPVKSSVGPVSLPAEVLREMAQTYSYDGFTPLLLACSKYYYANDKKQQARLRDMIKALIEEADSEVHAVVKKRSDDKARPIDGYSALHFLASAKDGSGLDGTNEISITTLQLVLNYKPPLNIRDNCGRTPLITAILSGQSSAAEALIKAGADINVSSEDVEEDGQASPLVLASKLGLVSITKLLLNHKADVEAVDQKNLNTSLHYAVCLKSAPNALEVVQKLVDAGVKVNSVNKDGQTPLHLAVNSITGSTDDSIEIEDYLIESGADLFAKDTNGRIPLHYAFVKIGKQSESTKIDPIEVVSLLTGAMKGYNVDCADNRGQTPLHCAAFRGSTISCMHLAKKMSYLNVRDKNGNTALSLSILGGHESCAIMLLQCGASIQGEVVIAAPHSKSTNKQNCVIWQWKPVSQNPFQYKRVPILEEVASKDWQGVMYMMIDQLQTSGTDYFPAIEAALCTNKFRLALSLISRMKGNSKLINCNSNNQNLLHLLALKAHADMQSELQLRVAELLMKRGLSLTDADMFGSYPITYASINKNINLCKYFTEKMGSETVSKLPADKLGRTPVTAVFWNVESCKWKDTSNCEIRNWCEKLLQTTALDSLGCYPSPGSEAGSLVFPKLPEPNATINQNWRLSPLIHAVCCQDYDLTTFLLRRGANVNFPDNNGCTPLMHAVKSNNIGMVKLLLNYDYSEEQNQDDQQKSDTDVKTPTKLGFRLGLKAKNKISPETKNIASEKEKLETSEVMKMEVDPVPEAESPVKNGDISKDRILKNDGFRKTSDADLTHRDNNGWTVVHYVVKPCKCGSYENIELLNLLDEVGAPLSEPNKSGETPLQLAITNKFSKIAEVLQKLTSSDVEIEIKPESPLMLDDQVEVKSKDWDFKKDAADLIKSIDSETMEDAEEEIIIKPDSQSGMEDTGEVIMDSDLNMYYDALLTKVDLNYGIWGRYNYYKMQIIRQKGKDLLMLLTRWGRIGTEGLFQQTPFRNLDDAVKEYCKIFKSKTGNNWSDVKSFQPYPKKYHLVTVDQRRLIKQRGISLNLDSEVPSKLPCSLQEFLKNLTNVHMLQEACHDIGVDINIMPFGRLSEEAVNKGREIILKLRELVIEKNKLEDDIEKRDKLTEVCEKLIVYSNEFYQVVPRYAYAYEKLQPLESLSSLQSCLDTLENMSELEVTSKLLLGGKFRIQEINPLDYIYYSMNCKVSLMAEDDEESQYILQYIHNTAHQEKPCVQGIYRVARNTELKMDCSINNHWFLWHGTPVANLISILTRGLQCGESSVPTAPQFNRGIYFSDMFEKSRCYTESFHNRSSQTQYILLCEVALGNMKLNVDGEDIEGPQEGFDSTKIFGTHFPDPKYNLTLPSGITVPLGAAIKGVNKYGAEIHRSTNYNEYIIFNKKQIPPNEAQFLPSVIM